jgi:hypothetical protein
MAIGESGHGAPSEPPISDFTFPGNDLYAAWALGAGRADFFPPNDQQTWITVLLELKGISALAFARGEDDAGLPLLDSQGDPRAIWLDNVVVPPLYLRQGDGSEDTLYLSAFVREAFFATFLEDEMGAHLQRFVAAARIGTLPCETALDTRLLDESQSIDPDPLVWPDLSGNPASEGVVIMGIIDDGIPFAHERFWQGKGKTRIEAVWLQDRDFNGVVGLQGRELTRNAIDEALINATQGGQVDEDSVYRELKAVDFQKDRPKSVSRRVSHGGHVMDLACGDDYRKTGNLDRPIVAVQLPTESTADTSGQSLEPYLDAAITYILYRAHLIAAERGTGPIPVVINLSYGHHLGAHDGTSLCERMIEHRIAERMARDGVPLRVVVPSGNSHLSRTHAEVALDSSGTTTLPWRIQPDDKTWSFMEIWLPAGEASGRAQVSITPPGGIGETISLGETNNGYEQIPPPQDQGAHECRITFKRDQASGRGVFLIEVAPTHRLGPHDGVVARSGLWTMTLEPTTGFPAGRTAHAWIWRDEPPLGFRRHGRQSYFDDATYRVYDEDSGRVVEVDDGASEIKRDGTISGLATSDGEMIVIGGYLKKESRTNPEDRRHSPYSAGGPTNGSRVGPEASAVSDDSMVHQGVIAAGARSGSTVALRGTSVAAPQVARWIANHVNGASLPGRIEVAEAATIELGLPKRSGSGGIDQANIDGVPIVDFPRFDNP